MADNSPSETVYVRNLNERIKIPKLVETLRDEFSQYGEVLDVIAKKNVRLRGQAFVVFGTVDAAAAALEKMSSKELFGKPIEVQFAKSKSDATVLREKGEEALAEYRKPRVEAAENAKRRLEAQAATGSEPPAKRAKPSSKKAPEAPPNSILFVERLPDGTTEAQLVEIFGNFNGFVEVRHVPVRKLAFVEYATEEQAVAVKQTTTGLEISNSRVSITYAKK